MIAPVCDACYDELTEFGAIVLAPPDDAGKAQKYHLCVRCYESIFIEGTSERLVAAREAAAPICLYGNVAAGGCALRATADIPPPERVQYREAVLENQRMRQALRAIRDMDDTEVRTRARSVARSALTHVGRPT